MGKRLPSTPRSRVRSALRQLWLRSRERNAAIKRESGHCQICGGKQSKARGKEFKIEVHHIRGVEWEDIIDYIFAHLLCSPEYLEVVCPECHDGEHISVGKQEGAHSGSA